MDLHLHATDYLAQSHWHGFRYRVGEMVGLDREKREVIVAPAIDDDGVPITQPYTRGYDTLVMAVGSLTNDFGTITAKSGETTQVRRSSKDLDIICKHPENPDATARAISRANAGMFGNIILGGGIGAIIDHNKGTAYTYPTWVQLEFGKSLVFDRSNEKDGQPAVAIQPPAAGPVATK